jgi:hypothetical protein
MELYNWEQLPAEQMNAMVVRKVIHSGQMTIARLKILKGAVVPEHSHVNEQIANVERGALLFHIGGVDQVVGAGREPGDSSPRSAWRGGTGRYVGDRRFHAAARRLDCGRRRLSAALSLEELAQAFHALHRQHAFHYLDAVIEDRRIRHLELTAHAAESQVAGAEDEALDAGGDQRSGTHHARFQRAVQGGAREAVVAQSRRRLANGQNFGMRRGVRMRNRRIGTAAHDGAAHDDYGAHRHLALVCALARQCERLPHKFFVGGHANLYNTEIHYGRT